ncbi:hypothetical protein HUJ05_008497 [Dendroctonus ponderosae]|nr:hypothetical protein HUJ05_008497 [Dendroctonus ponderosae]
MRISGRANAQRVATTAGPLDWSPTQSLTMAPISSRPTRRSPTAYRVNVSIKGTKSTFFGSFEFFLIDKFHFITTSSMMEPREFLAGESNSFVFYSGVPEMARIINAKIGWKEKPNAFCFVHCKQAIDVERVTIQSINSNTKYSQQVSLCPKDGMTEIQNGDFQEFEVCKK